MTRLPRLKGKEIVRASSEAAFRLSEPAAATFSYDMKMAGSRLCQCTQVKPSAPAFCGRSCAM